MANAVFNSYEDYLSKDTSNPVEHNTFDLSHIRSFTTTYGALIPFYLEDCLPSDHFNISNIVKVQSLPMSNPLFNNIKVSTWYFYVPYALLWRKFDLFINGGRDGTYTANLPFVRTFPSANSLGDYFGFPVCKSKYTSSSNIFYEINAFPYAAYQRIYRDYFFDQDLQTTSNYNVWFPEDDDHFSLQDGINYLMDNTHLNGVYYHFDVGYGNEKAPSSAGIQDSYMGGYFVSQSMDFKTASKELPLLQLIRFKNFKRDYFTSAMFSPQRGPIMGLSSTNVTPFSPSDFAGIVYDDSLSVNGNVVNIEPVTKKLFGASVSNLNLTNSSSAIKTFLSGYSNFLSNKLSSAITISDIMTASQVQLWMERNMQVKAQYNEFLRVHFGDAPLDERLTKPYYIGGTTQYININAVVQTSESSTTPQGTMTGLGSSQDSQFVGKFAVHEYGLIMGIMCIMPDLYYTDGMDKRWLKTSKFDFYFPEFAQLPPEPIYNKEIYWDNTSSSTYAAGDNVFGYSGHYDLYRHNRDLAVSDLRNPMMSDLSSWIIRRNFSSTPTLNSHSFICSLKTYGGCISIPAGYTDANGDRKDYNNIPMTHFPTNNLQNPFIVQVGLKITASRPLPYRNEPQTLNLRRG